MSNNIFKMTELPTTDTNLTFYNNTLAEVKVLSQKITDFINDNENKKNKLDNIEKDLKYLSILNESIASKLKKINL